MFDFLLKNRASTAIFLFPLNALAVDQQEKIEGLNKALPKASQLNLAIITGTKEGEGGGRKGEVVVNCQDLRKKKSVYLYSVKGIPTF